jgi:hypothetical protein
MRRKDFSLWLEMTIAITLKGEGIIGAVMTAEIRLDRIIQGNRR